MASIILSAAGGALGGQFGPIGRVVGRGLGSVLGNVINDRLFGGTRLKGREGPRLTDLAVQSSAYGKMVPIIYGTVRIAGNIIWSQPIRETVTTSTSSAGGGGKGGGGRVTQTSTTYSYSVTMAVAVCEGPVDEISRIWADAKLLDQSQYTLRIYKGTEVQSADTLISAIEGAANTPAYRGLAYVVLEDFPLAEFGNRIPNFTFEVKKRAKYADFAGSSAEDMVTGMTLIPGAGEFVYDPQVEYKVPGEAAGAGWAQNGPQVSLNMHNAQGVANVKLALDQLKATCPNVNWVSVVVSWFGDTMDAGTCIVKPGVEYQTGATTQPEVWSVGSFTRGTARLILQVDGAPQYGGTPDDESVVRLLDELNARGYNIMFYPMMFMDVPGKNWRGELTGSATNVASFFTKTNGFNAFITHYANLVAGKVNAFIIGSELKGLTKVTSAPGVYPAVSELVSLAATVKGILGSGVKVTYAADWSEYHHTDGGWYNLDPLWASANIDVVGIDAYFPIQDGPQSGYDVQALIDGWTEGEGYDYYYSDPERTVQAPLTPPYAWKNLDWWWNNTHTNPDASATAWTSQMKKIWFTEYGFPSVDGAANQPNVFYDAGGTSGSGFPYYSRGRIDFRAQRSAITATEAMWAGSAMVENKFLWTWDARPYPYWPDLRSVWSDGRNWPYGHWVQGKFGISSLAAIVKDLCERGGLDAADIDVSNITDTVEGYVLTSQGSIRSAIEQLQQGYFFDAVENGNLLKFVSRGQAEVATIPRNDLVRVEGRDEAILRIDRMQARELPRRASVVYYNRLSNYQSATQYAERQTAPGRDSITIDLPIVMSDQQARVVADVALYGAWVAQSAYRLRLPPKHLALEPADVIEVETDTITHRMRITSLMLTTGGVLEVEAEADDTAAYDFYQTPGSGGTGTEGVEPPAPTLLELLDTSALPGDNLGEGVLRLSGCGTVGSWNGSVVYRSDDGGNSYQRIRDILPGIAMGSAVNALANAESAVFDDANSVDVTLYTNVTLESATELAVLNGANLALLGNELIQFKTATLLEPGKYRLSSLLRGRLGTEHHIGSHTAGERFVLMTTAVPSMGMTTNLLNAPRLYKPVTVGSTLGATQSQSFSYSGQSLKPYAPVHVTGTRDGSANLTINWVRRARAAIAWLDYVEQPLNETTEAYEVEIMNGANVVRTITGLTTPQATYSAAEQTTDFGSPQSSVAVRVYQMSGVIGRGTATAASI